MEWEHYRIIRDKIHKNVSSKKDKLSTRTIHVNAILKRYIEMMWESVFRGNKVAIHHGASFCIDMQPIRTLTENEKKRFVKSDRHFGYMFTIKWEDPGDYHKSWTYYPIPEIMERLQELVNSDAIYELTNIET